MRGLFAEPTPHPARATASAKYSLKTCPGGYTMPLRLLYYNAERQGSPKGNSIGLLVGYAHFPCPRA
jgi:hypothetical protein